VLSEIIIPVLRRQNQEDEEPHFIVREVRKDLNINLKDWFVQILPPDYENGEEDWSMVFKERKPKSNN